MVEISELFEKNSNLYISDRSHISMDMFITLGRTFIIELPELFMSSYNSLSESQGHLYDLWTSKPEIGPFLGYPNSSHKDWISGMWLVQSDRSKMEQILIKNILDVNSLEVPEPELLRNIIGGHCFETRFYKIK